jgi:branched-chain amino acid transport system ATP-binding protein
MGTPLLELASVEAGYGAGRVLFGIDLSIAPGEVVGLLGRNGMGKTTTVRCIAGLLRPTAGTLRFAGEAIERASADDIARLGLGLVPEGRQIFPNLTVRENLVAFAARRNGTTDPWTLERVLALFPALEARLALPGARLSGGEQQMLAIGRALMTNPRLLILDEATEGLAPLVRESIWQCLRELRTAGQQAMLVIDKYVGELVGVADRHYIVERGAVAWQGTSALLAADRGLWERYLGV